MHALRFFFLIYILWCCDDSIVKNNVNKSNAAFKTLHAISLQKLWRGGDNSVSKKLTSAPRVIGSRTALFANDMSLCGLYESTIYWMINHAGVCEDYAFLLSYSQHGDRRWVFQGRGVYPKISHQWDNMTQFPEMVSSVIEDSSTFNWKPTKITFKHEPGREIKQIGFLGHWGRCPWIFQIWKDLHIVHSIDDFPQLMKSFLTSSYITNLE